MKTGRRQTMFSKEEIKRYFGIESISRSVFLKRLHDRSHEDIDLIRSIERTLKKDRGYVVTGLKQGDSVILLLSGGLDSVVVWEILLRVYKVKVYPLYLNRGQGSIHRSGRTVAWFERYFRDRYPDCYIAPYTISCSVPVPELIRQSERKGYLHPAHVMDSYLRYHQDFDVTYTSYNALPYIMPFYAMAYATYLDEHFNVSVHTIISGVTPSDGKEVLFQSFTSQRLIMMALNRIMPHRDWQYYSILFEKDLGLWFEKSSLIRYAVNQKIPLEHTWSCYKTGRRHCGKCMSCVGRKYYFSVAQVEDPVLYSTDQVPMKTKLKHQARTLRKKLRKKLW